MLRNQDFLCENCGRQWEELLRVEDQVEVIHCGVPSKKLAMAPAVKYREAHFNKAIGEWVNDAQDLDKKLKAKDLFVPTNNEIARAIENPHGITGKPKPDRAGYRAAAEKAYSLLHSTGKI